MLVFPFDVHALLNLILHALTLIVVWILYVQRMYWPPTLASRDSEPWQRSDRVKNSNKTALVGSELETWKMQC